MTLASLALLAVCGLTPGDDPADLVARLGSPQAAEREEAAGALEELGRPALPALYKARDGKDADLSRRADLLIDLIERQRLMRATRVKLDFADRPLSEAVEAVRERTGFPVVLEADAARRDRRVSVEAPEPVPFWEAIDRLGAAGGVRHNPGQSIAPEPRPLTLPLVADDGPPPPASYAGPFRVNVVRISRQREVVPARPPAEARVRDQLSVDLQVFAEPGLTLEPNGPLVLDAVSDDLGQDLRPGPGDGPPQRVPTPPRFQEGLVSLVHYHVPLRPPDRTGRRVARLKGYAPVTVAARTEPVVVVPLRGAEGKPFSGGDVTLTVAGVERQGDSTTIILKIRGIPDEPPFAPGTRLVPPGNYRPRFRIEDRVRVVDDRGQACRWWSPAPPRGGPDGEQEVRLNVAGGRARTPAELRYHDVVAAATEVAFEFADLPLP
jgi:hypothetical protein